MDFRVPIPSSLLSRNNNAGQRPLNNRWQHGSNVGSSYSSSVTSSICGRSIINKNGVGSQKPCGAMPPPSTPFTQRSFQHQISGEPLVTSSAPSFWGGSLEHGNRRDPLQYRQPNGMHLSTAPPPHNNLFHSVNDESTRASHSFFDNRMLHSTPLQQPLVRPTVDSILAPPSWAGSESFYHQGSELGRSTASLNIEYVDQVLQKALSKFIERSAFNSDINGLAVQVAKNLRRYAQEAAMEIAPEGSIRSHYSKQASTLRSGICHMRDPDQDTFNSLLRSPRSGRSVHKRLSPAPSIQCSIEGSSQRRKAEASGQVVERSLPSIVEKTVCPRKRSLSSETEASGDDCIVPQTVRRRGPAASDAAATHDQEVFGSPTTKNFGEKRAHEMAAVRRKKKKEEAVLDSKKDDSLRTPLRKGRNRSTQRVEKISNKAVTCKQKDEVPVVTQNEQPITVPRKKRPLLNEDGSKATKGKKQKPRGNACNVPVTVIHVNRAEKNASTKSRCKKSKKKANSGSTVNTNQEPKQSSAPKKGKASQSQHKTFTQGTDKATVALNMSFSLLVRTRSGRAVKPTTIYGQANNSSNVTPDCLPKHKVAKSKAKKPAKENVAPIVQTAISRKKKEYSANDEPAKCDSVAELHNNSNLPSSFKKSTADVDLNDLSFGAADFFIPEVTKSARRGGTKSKALKTVGAVGAQTPPLLHFTANLHPRLVSTTTPAHQTPDWHMSQRSQSEVKEFQKRKMQTKSKKMVAPRVAVPVKHKKPTKAMAAALKLVCEGQPGVTAGLQLLAPSYSSESEQSE